MKNKRLLATVMVVTMVVSSVTTPIASSVKAEEPTQEYVVMAKNDTGYNKVEMQYEETQDSEVLEENNLLVVEMTESDADKLEKDKNILLVEEDISFEACSVDGMDDLEKMSDDTTVGDISEEENTEMATELDKEQVEQTEEQIEEQSTGECNTEKTTDVSAEMDNKQGKKDKQNKQKKKTKTEDISLSVKQKRTEKENLRDQQWNLDAIHAVTGTGTDTIKIALLDSGVSFDEDVEIKERICINEENIVDNIMFDDTTGHGTAMAGIIGARDNEQGISGINPNAEIYSVQILDENNQTTLSQVIAGIYYAIEQNCDIINMSFGTNVNSAILHEAIRDAYDNDILLIAAAGNNADKPVEYPAAYEEVLAVGSTDTTGSKIPNTCDGKEIEILAPGSQIVTSGLFGGFIVTEGTSIATAQVSGAASLVWEMDKNKSAEYIRSLLVATSQKVQNAGISDSGLIDVENAIKQYNVFSEIYTEQKREYSEIENRDTEDYTGVKLVNGSWSGDNHASQVSSSTSGYGINSDYIRLMQAVARQSDTTYKSAGYLHGSHNYVKGLKFLYQCAIYIRNGKGIDDALSLAEKDAKMNRDKNSYDKSMIDQTRKMLKDDVLSGVEESSTKAKYYKVMGFAMHLAGDVYAHRTIVPTYTVSGTNPGSIKNSTSVTSADAKFGFKDFKAQSTHSVQDNATLKKWAKNPSSYSDICKRWKCFEQTVKLGVMEFRDIKYYMATYSTGKYEDNINFCKERYADAKLNCEVLFEAFYYKEKFDGIEILYPTEKHVKLNNLKNYAKNAGEDINGISESEWKEMSTMEEY